MIHKRAIFFFAAMVMMAALAAVPARAQFGAVEGDVKDAEGKPMVGAWVLIERIDIKGNYKVKSDRKGHYFHGGLPLGQYNLKLTDPNNQVLDQVSNVRLRLGDPMVINFDLKQARDRAMAAQAGIKLESKPGAPGAEAPQLSKEQREQIEKMQKQAAAQKEKMEKLNKSFATGMEALKAKNYALAITELEAASLTDPNQHVIWANLGEAYLGSARTKRGEEATAEYGKAITNYEKALALKADDAAYYNNYGLALAQSGKMPEAEQALGKAAQLDPPNAGRYYFNLGALLVNTGKLKEAASAFKKATEADPNYAEAWYQLGLHLYADAKLDEKTGKITPVPGTVDALQKYMALAPTGPNAEAAKSLIEALGGTIQTQFKTERPARKR